MIGIGRIKTTVFFVRTRFKFIIKLIIDTMFKSNYYYNCCESLKRALCNVFAIYVLGLELDFCTFVVDTL